MARRSGTFIWHIRAVVNLHETEHSPEDALALQRINFRAAVMSRHFSGYSLHKQHGCCRLRQMYLAAHRALGNDFGTCALRAAQRVRETKSRRAHISEHVSARYILRTPAHE